jgi:hypothetical protein
MPLPTLTQAGYEYIKFENPKHLLKSPDGDYGYWIADPDGTLAYKRATLAYFGPYIPQQPAKPRKVTVVKQRTSGDPMPIQYDPAPVEDVPVVPRLIDMVRAKLETDPRSQAIRQFNALFGE